MQFWNFLYAILEFSLCNFGIFFMQFWNFLYAILEYFTIKIHIDLILK
jgi:hypothetical protein